MPSPRVLLQSDLELPLLFRGKVRDVFDLGEHLLLVTTDRISAFDRILPFGIPGKGRVLARLSAWWFRELEAAGLCEHHLVSDHREDMPAPVAAAWDDYEGRSHRVLRAEVQPFECVVRGRLAGSGWKEYRESGAVCGIALPSGLGFGEALPQPIFTPATKVAWGPGAGHDENVSFERLAAELGTGLARELRDRSLAVFRHAEALLARRGLVLCDTKFEWGLVDGRLRLVDEALTPDSSRYWPAEGGPAQGFDKQYVRDRLIEAGFRGEGDPPTLPPEVLAEAAARYRNAYEAITGSPL